MSKKHFFLDIFKKYLLFFALQKKEENLKINSWKTNKPNDLFLIMFAAFEENPPSCGRSFPTSPLSQTPRVGSVAL